MSSGGERTGGSVKTPADFLKSIRGRPVVVKLNSGVDYRGTVFLPSPFSFTSQVGCRRTRLGS